MSTRLRGRDQELVAVQHWLGRVVDGRGDVALVDGVAGIGKSRLLAEAAAVAAGDGFLVVSGRANQLGGVAPMSTLLDAFRDSDPPVVTPADMAGLSDLADQRFWLLDRLRSALEKQAGERPVLVVLDDLQWADSATLWAVGALAAQVTAMPVAWLLARRRSPSRPDVDALVERLTAADPLVVSLGRLRPEASDALVEDLIGSPPNQSLLDFAHRAEGNPFLVVEAVHAAARSGVAESGLRADDARTELPPGLRLSARNRFAGLGPDASRLLEVGAVFGRRFSIPAVSAMLGRSVSALTPAIRELLDAGLLVEDGDRLAFAHDLLWQAVYEDLPASARWVLHRDAARILLAGGAPPLEVADHLLAGAGPGDVEAVDLLLAAAREAASCAPGTAADLYTRVLQLAPEPGPRHSRALVEAVPVLVRAGRMNEMRRIADSALAAGVDPDSAATVHYAMSVGAALSGKYAEALAQSRLGLARTDLPSSARALLRSVEALYLAMRGEVEPALATALGAVRAGELTGQGTAVSMGLPAAAIAQRLAGRFGEAARLAEQAARRADGEEPAARILQPRRWYAWLLTALDQLDEADAAYLQTRRDMDALGLGVLQHLWYVHRSGLRLAAGRLDEAVAEAEAAVAVAEELETVALLPTALALLARIAVYRGDPATAAAYLARAPVRGDSVYELELDLARGMVADAEGDPELSVAQMAPIWSAFTHHFGILALNPPAAPHLVRVALRAHDAERANLAAAAATRLAVLNPEVATVVGAATHATGLLADDADELRAAVDAYADSPRPLARASASEDAGVALGAQAEKAAALPYLEEALRLFVAADATGDAGRVRRELRALGVRQSRCTPERPRTGWGSLSTAERRVAALVADGLTNRIVADRLFLSRHTVDSHLRHIFAKLDINTRVGLTRVVVAHEPGRPADPPRVDANGAGT